MGNYRRELKEINFESQTKYKVPIIRAAFIASPEIAQRLAYAKMFFKQVCGEKDI